MQTHIDHFFAAANTTKDGKLTKDQVANFFWNRISKAAPKGASFVTKDQLVAYVKERIKERMARHEDHHGPQAHRGHEKAKSKAAEEKSKKESAPAKPESKPETKSEPKAQLEKLKDLKAGTSAT